MYITHHILGCTWRRIPISLATCDLGWQGELCIFSFATIPPIETSLHKYEEGSGWPDILHDAISVSKSSPKASFLSPNISYSLLYKALHNALERILLRDGCIKIGTIFIKRTGDCLAPLAGELSFFTRALSCDPGVLSFHPDASMTIFLRVKISHHDLRAVGSHDLMESCVKVDAEGSVKEVVGGSVKDTSGVSGPLVWLAPHGLKAVLLRVAAMVPPVLT